MIRYVKDMPSEWGEPNLTGLVESCNWQFTGSVWVYNSYAVTMIELVGMDRPTQFRGWIPQSYRWEIIDGFYRCGKLAIPDGADFLCEWLLEASVRLAMSSAPGSK